jgi:hypothetical protein
MTELPSALETEAARLDWAASELEQAASHCRVAARHYRSAEVPRAAAHAWAAWGHLEVATDALRDGSVEHARRSRAE